MPAALLIFPPDPELRLRDPIEAATDHVRVAVVDYAIAIQDATTVDRAVAIRKQIEARIVELRAVSGYALDKEIAIEAVEDRAVDRIVADLQRLNKE